MDCDLYPLMTVTLMAFGLAAIIGLPVCAVSLLIKRWTAKIPENTWSWVSRGPSRWQKPAQEELIAAMDNVALAQLEATCAALLATQKIQAEKIESMKDRLVNQDEAWRRSLSDMGVRVGALLDRMIAVEHEDAQTEQILLDVTNRSIAARDLANEAKDDVARERDRVNEVISKESTLHALVSETIANGQKRAGQIGELLGRVGRLEERLRQENPPACAQCGSLMHRQHAGPSSTTNPWHCSAHGWWPSCEACIKSGGPPLTLCLHRSLLGGFCSYERGHDGLCSFAGVGV